MDTSPVLLVLCVCMGYTNSLEITSGAAIDGTLFPFQVPNPADPGSFFRKGPDNAAIEKIFCPVGTAFDKVQLRCIRSNERSIRKDWGPKLESCQGGNGPRPDPDNCRNFINCWAGNGFEAYCGDTLLFNADELRCDWPLEAGCCEYVEEDSDRIVE